jgi:hypothetical protein
MTNLTRATAIRRALRNLDALKIEDQLDPDRQNAAIELELGRIFDAGHIAGSGVRSLTEAEKDLAEWARCLGEYQVTVIAEHVDPAVVTIIDAIRNEGSEPVEPDDEATQRADHLIDEAKDPRNHSLTGCYGHGHD